MLKDQFIFGIHNKEIQDHLLGEIKETDNSVRVLYEVCKVESKLAQRQMLGIVNPSTLVSVEAIKKASKMVIETLMLNSMTKIVITVDVATREGKGIVQHLAKAVTNVVVKTTLEQSADLVIVDLSLSQGMTQEGQIGPIEENSSTDTMYMKLVNVMMTWRT